MKMEGWVGSSGLTFRLWSSPGGLSGSIIFRYSSLESLCSDFPSRSAVWSRQAASCAYSCLRVIERGHRRTGAHQKRRGVLGKKWQSARGCSVPFAAWLKQFGKITWPPCEELRGVRSLKATTCVSRGRGEKRGCNFFPIRPPFPSHSDKRADYRGTRRNRQGRRRGKYKDPGQKSQSETSANRGRHGGG